MWPLADLDMNKDLSVQAALATKGLLLVIRNVTGFGHLNVFYTLKSNSDIVILSQV